MKYVLLMFPFGYISCPLKLVCNIISLSLPFETRAGRVLLLLYFLLTRSCLGHLNMYKAKSKLMKCRWSCNTAQKQDLIIVKSWMATSEIYFKKQMIYVSIRLLKESLDDFFIASFNKCCKAHFHHCLPPKIPRSVRNLCLLDWVG